MRTVAGILDTQQPTEPENLYDRDFYTWARQQANALKQRNFTAIDWENITEEIEALVRAEESSLRSQYVRIIEHFLKLQYRKDRETEPVAGWKNSIDNARIEIEELLQDSPGLKHRCDELFHGAWDRARKRAIMAFVHHAIERVQNYATLLREQKRLTREWSRILPRDNPYTRQQVEDSFWLPEWAGEIQRPQSPANIDRTG